MGRRPSRPVGRDYFRGFIVAATQLLRPNRRDRNQSRSISQGPRFKHDVYRPAPAWLLVVRIIELQMHADVLLLLQLSGPPTPALTSHPPCFADASAHASSSEKVRPAAVGVAEAAAAR